MALSLRDKIFQLVGESNQVEEEAHPAKSDLNYDRFNQDVYPTLLDDELEQLQDANRDTTTKDLTCLPYISTVHNLEQTISQSKALLAEGLQKQEKQAQRDLDKELRLYDELTALRAILQTRIETIDNTIHTRSPENILEDTERKVREENKASKQKLGELKKLLHDYIAPNITPDGENIATVGRELKTTIENLLNQMFNSEGSNDDGYVEIDDINSPVVLFLLRGELAVPKPDDAHFIKLREYGKD